MEIPLKSKLSASAIATKTGRSRKPIIAPSVLSADFGRLAEEIREVEKAGCDVIHVDVMDGRFVPNLTVGPVVLAWIRKATRVTLDVHLMIEEPIRYLRDFRRAGADWITVHVEACRDVSKTLRAVKALGASAGVSVKPKTSVGRLVPFLKEVDLVLVMSVEPGFGGQSFMPETMKKVSALRSRFGGLISVDGGINPVTIRRAREAGADIFVAGSAVFSTADRRKNIEALRRAVC
jgi:ribulose-phosphate 3-epimerase